MGLYRQENVFDKTGGGEAVASDDGFPDSLCWNCRRRMWACLCQHPRIIPDGCVIIEKPNPDGEPFLLVVECALRWPDEEDEDETDEMEGAFDDECEGVE